MKRQWLTMLTLVGCAGMLTATAAQAQTTITLASSSEFVEFYTGSPAGNLNVNLGWTPGDNNAGSRTLDGALGNSGTPGSWGSNPNFSLTTNDPIALAGNGSGTFTAQAPSLAGSVFDVMSGAGATVFQGMLSALSFDQAAGSNAVTMTATLDGTGSFSSAVYNLMGSIILAPGANLEAVANSSSQIDEAGVIVPEPASVMLFGTGLLMLVGLGVMRRRQWTA